MATEKLSNVVKPFAKAFGAGVSDDLVEAAIGRAVERYAKTAAGKTALEGLLKTGAGFVSEGAEEFLEDMANPILKRMTYDPSAQFDLEEAAYDFLIGGALGGIGGALGGIGSGFEQAGNRVRKNASAQNTTAVRNGTVQAAGTQAAQTDGNSMGTQESGVEGVSGGIMEQEVQRLFGQQKAASTGETAGMLKADTSLFNRDILQNFNSARTYLIEFARKHFPSSVVNAETGKTIGISRKGLDKFLSGNVLYEKYASGFHIPELIERGHKVAEAGNYHPETVDSIPLLNTMTVRSRSTEHNTMPTSA